MAAEQLHEKILRHAFLADSTRPASLTTEDLFWRLEDASLSLVKIRECLDWLVRQGDMGLDRGKYSLTATKFFDLKTQYAHVVAKGIAIWLAPIAPIHVPEFRKAEIEGNPAVFTAEAATASDVVNPAVAEVIVSPLTPEEITESPTLPEETTVEIPSAIEPSLPLIEQPQPVAPEPNPPVIAPVPAFDEPILPVAEAIPTVAAPIPVDAGPRSAVVEAPLVAPTPEAPAIVASAEPKPPLHPETSTLPIAMVVLALSGGMLILDFVLFPLGSTAFMFNLLLIATHCLTALWIWRALRRIVPPLNASRS